MSRKINSETLSNKQKIELRNSFNEQEGTTFSSITQIRKYLHIADTATAYEKLRDLYNNAIDAERKKRLKKYREEKN